MHFGDRDAFDIFLFFFYFEICNALLSTAVIQLCSDLRTCSSYLPEKLCSLTCLYSLCPSQLPWPLVTATYSNLRKLLPVSTVVTFMSVCAWLASLILKSSRSIHFVPCFRIPLFQRLDNIPLGIYSTFPLSLHPLINT